MADKKAQKKSVESIEISDFFVTTKETDGVWMELFGTGIELKVLGNSSPKVIKAASEYVKEHDAIEKIEDVMERHNRERDAVCKRIAASVTDIRAKDGKVLKLKGKEVQYSEELVYRLMVENISIRTEVLSFSSDSENFMNRR